MRVGQPLFSLHGRGQGDIAADWVLMGSNEEWATPQQLSS